MMAKIRNTMDGKKRQASVLGSTLTSLTFESEETETSSGEEEVSEDDTYEEDEVHDKSRKSGEDENSEKQNVKPTTGEKKQSDKNEGKPKVRMKTLTIDGHLVYFCVICDKIFTRKKDKINHELAHSNKTLLSCPECGKEYAHESSLAYHIRTHDGELLHFCDLCPKMFAQNHQLQAHILSHSQPTEFSCKVCNIDCDSASDLKCHHRNKVKEEMTTLWCDMCQIFCCRNHFVEQNFSKLHAFQCAACNDLFYTQKKLRLHAKKFAHKLSNRAKVKSLKEDEEEHFIKEILKVKARSSHTKRQPENNIDEGSETKKCHVSADTVQPQGHLNKESETDELKPKIELSRKTYKKKPYCKKCNRSFKDSSDLVSHKLSTHFETIGDLVCSICGQESSSTADLEEHMSKHKMDTENVSCKLCHKIFSSKLQLTQHAKLHNPQESDSLDRPGIKMGIESDLLDSGNSEVFKCHICFKVFPFRCSLQNHLRLHTNIKSFQCYICQKDFVTKHYLQLHLQVHVQNGGCVQSEHKDDTNGFTHNKHKDLKDENDKGLKENDSDFQFNRTLAEMKMETDSEEIRFGGCEKPLLDLKSSVKSEFDMENVSGFSGNSICSVLTRDSERSVAVQFSSDSSHSFKISMARERRKLRKRKLLSKSLLRNSFKQMKEKVKIGSEETSNVFADRLNEEENRMNDLIVEINGVKSEADQETIIFVELTRSKLAPKFASSLVLNEEIDKENKLPSSCTDNSWFASEELNNNDIFDVGRIPSHILSEKVLVLDIEPNHLDNDNFGSPYITPSGPSSQKIYDFDETENVGSSNLHVNEKSKDFHKKWICTENSESFSNPLLKSPLKDGHPLHCEPHVVKEMTPSEQPLHSLHLMTAKLTNDRRKMSALSVTSGNSMEREMKESDIRNDFQDEKSSLSSSGKTCRDIAASWKSNKNLSTNRKNSGMMSKPVKHSYLSHSKENMNVLDESPDKSIKSLSLPSMKMPKSESFDFDFKDFPSQTACNSKDAFIDSEATTSSTVLKAKDSEGTSFLPQSYSATHPCTNLSSVSSEITNPSAFSNSQITVCNATDGVSNVSSQPPRNVCHFDTNNPALRDMNLMDMVCSIQTSSSANKSMTDPGNLFHKSPQNINELIGVGSSQIQAPALGTSSIASHPFMNNSSQLEQPSPLDVFNSQRIAQNNVNTSNIFLNPLPPFSLNDGSNINPPSVGHFNELCTMNPGSYGTPSFYGNYPVQPSFNRVDHQNVLGMNSAFPQFNMPPGYGGLGRGTYNMDNLHLGSSVVHQGQSGFITPNPSHFGLNAFPPGMSSSIPMIPKIRNPSEMFMGQMDPKPLQPGFPLTCNQFNHPMMPSFPSGLTSTPPFSSAFIPTPPNILPNPGLVQTMQPKMIGNMNGSVFFI